MAIDSTLFIADIPAGTYTEGQRIPLTAKLGPAVVRDGYGDAKLKGIWSGEIGTGTIVSGYFEIQNSNWVDSVVSLATQWSTVSASENSQCYNPGFDAQMTPNSGWEVNLVVGRDTTLSEAQTAFVIIDIDYPKVGSVANPMAITGTPSSTVTKIPCAVGVAGSMLQTNPSSVSVDILKAGYRYVQQKLSILPEAETKAANGFLIISGAASMGGLQRIMPISAFNGHLRPKITYTSVLTKGPMNMGLLMLGSAAASETAQVIIDYVKRAV